MPIKPLHIAIDGPIGSGKSTVAREVAKKLGILLVDAGALYRTVAFIAKQNHISPSNAAEAAFLFLRADIVQRSPASSESDGRKITLLLNQKDITWKIRTHEIDDLVAKFAEYKEVIKAVHQKEREIAQNQSVVIEGREIGTIVLPQAQVKVYLTADIKARCQRRFEEYERRGNNVSHSEIVRALKARDELDMRRAYAPLRKAGDAVLIDTTNKSVEEVVTKILRLVPESRNFRAVGRLNLSCAHAPVERALLRIHMRQAVRLAIADKVKVWTACLHYVRTLKLKRLIQRDGLDAGRFPSSFMLGLALET